MTTVSSASGGARISRHENASRLWRDALPQRVRWSRMLTAAWVSPRPVAWRLISCSIAPGLRRLEPRFEDGLIERRSAGEMDDDLVLLDPAAR